MAAVVEEPKEQRPDVGLRSVLVPAEPGDHTVGRPLVLDLEHRPFARLVGRLEQLGDDAVEARAFEPVEPVGRQRAVGRGGREVDRRHGLAQDGLEPRAPFSLRHLAQVLAAQGKQVPRHERRRRLPRQHADPRFGRVDSQEQRVEVEPVLARDHDLAVQHATIGKLLTERRRELGEVAVQGLEVPALGEHLVAVAKDQGPEAVPLGLEEPRVGRRQFARELGQHWLQGRLEWKAHCGIIGVPTFPRRAASVLSWPWRGHRLCFQRGLQVAMYGRYAGCHISASTSTAT